MRDPARSLQDEEFLPFERRMWVVQRIGWGLMLVTVIGAVLGVFGSGPLNDRKLDVDGAVVTYPYFLRAGAPAELVITADAPSGGLLVTLDGRYLEKMDVERVIPDAVSQRSRDGTLRWEFGAGGRARVVLTLKPKTAGAVSASLGLGGAAPKTLRHFIYP